MRALSSLVVTGAGGALGRTLVRTALDRGWRVLAVTRRSAWSGAVSPRLHTATIDLAATDGSARLAETLPDWHAGEVFAVANCVGMFPGYRRIDEITAEEGKAVFESNLHAVYNTAHAVVPLMRAVGGGYFLAFSSHSRYQSYPLMAAFDAAKAAVVQLVRHIANEGAESGIVANTLALATLLTDAERSLKPHGDHRAWLHPEEVAEYALWLMQAPGPALNGNELHLFNYSESYFRRSYFERIER